MSVLTLDGVAERCDETAGPRWRINCLYNDWYVGLDKVPQTEKNRLQGHYCDFHGSVLTLEWDTKRRRFKHIQFDVPSRPPTYELSEIVWMNPTGWGAAIRECGCKIFVSCKQVTTEGPPLAPGIEIWHTTALFSEKVQAVDIQICLPRKS
jgi:hypothetical protein